MLHNVEDSCFEYLYNYQTGDFILSLKLKLSNTGTHTVTIIEGQNSDDRYWIYLLKVKTQRKMTMFKLRCIVQLERVDAKLLRRLVSLIIPLETVVYQT